MSTGVLHPVACDGITALLVLGKCTLLSTLLVGCSFGLVSGDLGWPLRDDAVDGFYSACLSQTTNTVYLV